MPLFELIAFSIIIVARISAITPPAKVEEVEEVEDNNFTSQHHRRRRKENLSQVLQTSFDDIQTAPLPIFSCKPTPSPKSKAAAPQKISPKKNLRSRGVRKSNQGLPSYMHSTTCSRNKRSGQR
mmetsp:Transcript_7147/g.13218  ORF Transcript_7147/g.13218 Transcript_7147/m.13218 type:complete len:124 (+) Transcript_7147:663-1034(+)